MAISDIFNKLSNGVYFSDLTPDEQHAVLLYEKRQDDLEDAKEDNYTGDYYDEP